jgi:transposase-like protein
MNKQEAIEKAKQLLKNRQDLKYEIVKIAISVCVNIRGGKVSAHQYTIKHFAVDIGVNPNTLHRWKREYELVLSKVSGEKPKRKALEETLKRVGKKTPAKEVQRILAEQSSKLSTPDDERLADCLKRLKGVDFFINHSSRLSLLDRETLATCAEVSKSIYFGIENFLSGKRRPAYPREEALKRFSELAI